LGNGSSPNLDADGRGLLEVLFVMCCWVWSRQGILEKTLDDMDDFEWKDEMNQGFKGFLLVDLYQ